MFMDAGTHWLKVSFTDELGGAVNGGETDEAEGRFEVLPAGHAH